MAKECKCKHACIEAHTVAGSAHRLAIRIITHHISVLCETQRQTRTRLGAERVVFRLDALSRPTPHALNAVNSSFGASLLIWIFHIYTFDYKPATFPILIFYLYIHLKILHFFPSIFRLHKHAYLYTHTHHQNSGGLVFFSSDYLRNRLNTGALKLCNTCNYK